VIALLPLLIFLLAWLLRAASPAWRHVLLCTFLLLWLSGSLNQRFNPDHRKDDYRSAVARALAAEAAGARVLWMADPETAAYYGYYPEWDYGVVEMHDAWRQADMVFYSKPDIFDQNQIVAHWLNERASPLSNRLPAFTIWAHEGSRD
jgi:hypothetical protein